MENKTDDYTGWEKSVKKNKENKPVNVLDVMRSTDGRREGPKSLYTRFGLEPGNILGTTDEKAYQEIIGNMSVGELGDHALSTFSIKPRRDKSQMETACLNEFRRKMARLRTPIGVNHSRKSDNPERDKRLRELLKAGR